MVQLGWISWGGLAGALRRGLHVSNEGGDGISKLRGGLVVLVEVGVDNFGECRAGDGAGGTGGDGIRYVLRGRNTETEEDRCTAETLDVAHNVVEPMRF